MFFSRRRSIATRRAGTDDGTARFPPAGLLPVLALLLCVTGLPGGALAAGDLPRPSGLTAEPTPNDDGTHVTLRWPATEAEIALAESSDGDREPGDYEYVIYVSRDPDWRWFECKRMPPAGGFVTDPGVAGYYPYRFSAGREHYAIMSPTGAMKVRVGGQSVGYSDTLPWLAREQQYADWLDGALGKLNKCHNLLVRLKRSVAERRSVLDRYATAEPDWRTELAKARETYLKRFGPPEGGAEFDALELVRKLKTRREEQEGTAERLEVLEPALRLNAARQRKEALRKEIRSYRQAFFTAAASYARYRTLLDGECRLALAGYGNLEPAGFDRDAVARLLPDVKRDLAVARRDLRDDDATPRDYARYDRLVYLRHLAEGWLERSGRQPSWRSIRTDLLWNLARVMQAAELPEQQGSPEAEGGQAEPPDTDALLQSLEALNEARVRLQRRPGDQAVENWESASGSYGEAGERWLAGQESLLKRRFRAGDYREPGARYYRKELARLTPVVAGSSDRLLDIKRRHARRTYHFRLAVAPTGEEPGEVIAVTTAAAARPNLFDFSQITNIVFAAVFAAAVVGMLVYVRRNPKVFIRKIPGLDAVDEAIGRATEMGKPVLFVHGLSEISTIAVIASLNVLSKIAREVALYDTELLVANERPIVYSASYEVVKEGYMEAGRPDAFNPDNVMMVATEQFPYVAAVAGIMNRRKPAANLFMGKFYAESLILAEAGVLTGAMQIAATDAFTQLPFFITTCDYTLMGEELYAASAYLSRDPKLLGTIKAQDVGKGILLAAVPTGAVLASAGINVIKVIFTAYTKA